MNLPTVMDPRLKSSLPIQVPVPTSECPSGFAYFIVRYEDKDGTGAKEVGRERVGCVPGGAVVVNVTTFVPVTSTTTSFTPAVTTTTSIIVPTSPTTTFVPSPTVTGTQTAGPTTPTFVSSPTKTAGPTTVPTFVPSPTVTGTQTAGPTTVPTFVASPTTTKSTIVPATPTFVSSPTPTTTTSFTSAPGPSQIPRTTTTSTSASGGAGGGGEYMMMMLANGGLAMPQYFAKGSLARGTDKIPAMLSPGEFVVSKYAVQNYGVDRLRAINNGTNQDSSVYNYSINVNVKSGADANDIARKVITQIQQIDSQRIQGQRY